MGHDDYWEEIECQIFGMGKHPAGISLIVRSMSIPIAQPILIRRAPAGKVPIHKMKSCSGLKEIVKLARFLNFILFPKQVLNHRFPH